MTYKDPVRRKQYQREWVQANRREWFEGKVCAQCGVVGTLELDHINPRTKEDHAIWSWSSVRREAELTKCQALCEPCHADKTALENRERFSKGQCNGVNRGAYRKGCRCDKCKMANRLYNQKWRLQKASRLGRPQSSS